MIVESVLSVNLRHLSQDNLNRIQRLIEKFNFELMLRDIDETQFLNALKRDKKVRKGTVRFIFPTDIGQTKSVDGVTNPSIIAAMKQCFGDIIK